MCTHRSSPSYSGSVESCSAARIIAATCGRNPACCAICAVRTVESRPKSSAAFVAYFAMYAATIPDVTGPAPSSTTPSAAWSSIAVAQGADVDLLAEPEPHRASRPGWR